MKWSPKRILQISSKPNKVGIWRSWELKKKWFWGDNFTRVWCVSARNLHMGSSAVHSCPRRYLWDTELFTSPLDSHIWSSGRETVLLLVSSSLAQKLLWNGLISIAGRPFRTSPVSPNHCNDLCWLFLRYYHVNFFFALFFCSSSSYRRPLVSSSRILTSKLWLPCHHSFQFCIAVAFEV